MRLAVATPVCIASKLLTKVWAWDGKFWILSDSDAKLKEVVAKNGSNNSAGFITSGYKVVEPNNVIAIPSPVNTWADVCPGGIVDFLPEWARPFGVTGLVAGAAILVLLLTRRS